MENIVNTDKVERGARIGKIASFVGFGLLVAGLIASLIRQAPSLIWVSFGFLIAGIVVSSIGTMNMNRWVKEPRADQALARGLKGFDDRYRLYNYILPARHVLLSPAGLIVLTALGQDGVIRYDGEKFKRDFSAGRLLRFMADEGLGKPFAEAESQVKALRAYLDEHSVPSSGGGEVEINSILVFYSPNVELVLDDTTAPVTVPKGLKKIIRRQDGALKGKVYDELRELFEAAAEDEA
jgi:hypothetical protein